MVEKFINYSDDVDNIQDAFGFVMDYFTEFAAPSVSIDAYMSYDNILDLSDEDKGQIRYGVRVSGVVKDSDGDDVN